MKIVHLINVRWFNATAWYALRLAESALKRGDGSAIAGLPDSPVIKKARELGINVLEAPFTSNKPYDFYKNLRLLHKFLEEEKADALVCHRGEMFWILALDKFFCKRSYKLIRVRGDVRPPSTDIFSRFTHNVCCNHIITSADFIRDNFIKGLKTKESHIDTLYGGVNREIFHYDSEKVKVSRAKLGLNDSDFAVGIVGRYDEVKGHKIFLEACGTAYKRGMKDLRVVISGFKEGITDEEIDNMISVNGLKDITIKTGRVEDITEVMAGLNLGVISSLGSEAICRVAMEFMAMGVPVVSSCAGVLPEIIPDIYRYENYDSDGLAELILNRHGFIKIYDQLNFYDEFLNKTSLLNKGPQ